MRALKSSLKEFSSLLLAMGLRQSEAGIIIINQMLFGGLTNEKQINNQLFFDLFPNLIQRTGCSNL